MIPETIIKDRREYIFVEEYPNFLLYKNAQTGTKTCFKWDEIEDAVQRKSPRGRPPKIPNNHRRANIWDYQKKNINKQIIA